MNAKTLSQKEAENRYLKVGFKLLERYKGAKFKYKTMCSCGKLFSPCATSVFGGLTSSCGSHRGGSKNSGWTGYQEIPGSFWSKIISGCTRGKYGDVHIRFDITICYAWSLFLKQNRRCALSGLELKFGSRCTKKETTASLDRIDSSKGYIEGNVQWIHKKFQKTKWSDPEDIFFQKVKEIYEYKHLENFPNV